MPGLTRLPLIGQPERLKPELFGENPLAHLVHQSLLRRPVEAKLPASSGSNAPISPIDVARVGVPLGRVGQV
jgi:hypothetical protein